MEQKKEPQANNDHSTPSGNQKLLVGLISGILIGLLVAFYFLDYFPLTSTFFLHFLIAFFIIFIIGLLTFTWFKERILKKFLGKDFNMDQATEQAKGIYGIISEEYIGKLLEKLPKLTQEQGRNAAPELLKMGIWAFTRSWALRLALSLFVAIGGLLGAILLYNQNQLLSYQNEKIDSQNDKLDVQNNLMEAGRRSSLIFLMSNVLDKVDDEIQNEKTKRASLKIRDTFPYNLSDPLIGRIVALSRAFRPYRVLENDTLSNVLVSPERGQLFIALMKSNLDSASQNTIVADGDFSNIVIGNLELKKANFKGANFARTNFGGIDLSEADFTGADLRWADLSEVNLSKSNLRGANLREAKLREADLYKANLRSAYLIDTNFSRAKLNGANLIRAELFGADLSRTELIQADLREADFYEADLRGADLRFARLYKSDFSGADLTGADFTIGQLIRVSSLMNSKNLHPKMEQILREKRPCIFTDLGCYEE